MRKGSNLPSRARGTECSDFVELARRMSVPADIAIHEFMDRGSRVRPADPNPVRDASSAELATAKS